MPRVCLETPKIPWTIIKMLHLALVLLFCGLAVGQNSVRFAVIGDWGDDSSRQYEVAEAMGQWCDTYRCDFIVTTGDNFYNDGVESPTDPRFDTTWKNVYTHAAIRDLTWYISIGNHDHGYDPPDTGREWYQVYYGDTEPRWYMPHLTYGFTANSDSTSVKFVMIDTQSLRHNKNDRDGMLELLDRELANSNADWKLVVGHHPAYSGGRHAGSSTIRNRVMPILIENNVDMYIMGHDHNMQHWQRTSGTDVDHVLTGGGGRGRYSYSSSNHAESEAQGFTMREFFYNYGFAYFIIYDTEISVWFVDEQQNILYSFERTK